MKAQVRTGESMNAATERETGNQSALLPEEKDRLRQGRRAARGAKRLAACGAILAVLLTSGCRQYEIEVTINPDGSGSRTLRLQVDPDDLGDEGSDLAEFTELYGVGPGTDWTMEREREQGGKQEVLVFNRHSEPAGLGDWRLNSGDLRIRGALALDRFANVAFANDLSVEVASGTNLRTYTYRERFSWTGLREILTERQGEGFFNRLRGSYPYLNDEDRRELTGLLAGAILATVELESSSKENEGVADALTRAVEAHAEDVIHRHDPTAACADLAQITHDSIAGADQDLEAFLRRDLPGAYLAGATSIELTVTMPGHIVDSNADRVEGKTAVWTLDTWDALVRPVELFVRSELSE